MQDDVDHAAGLDGDRLVGGGRLLSAVGGRAGVEQPQVARSAVPRDVAVAEHQEVGVRERRSAPEVATRGGSGLVDHCQPETVDLDPGHLREPRPDVLAVVVAAAAHEGGRPGREGIEQRYGDPVTGVYDQVGPIYRTPYLGRQVAGPGWHVGVGQQEQFHTPTVPHATGARPVSDVYTLRARRW